MFSKFFLLMLILHHSFNWENCMMMWWYSFLRAVHHWNLWGWLLLFLSNSSRIITSLFVFAVLWFYHKKMEHHKHWFWTVALATVTIRVLLCTFTRAAWRLLLCNMHICVCMHACVHMSVLVYTHVSMHVQSYICICILLYKLVSLTCVWEVTIFNLW